MTSLPVLSEDFADSLKNALPEQILLGSDPQLEDVAFHDFHTYEYVFDPLQITQAAGELGDYSGYADREAWEAAESSVRGYIKLSTGSPPEGAWFVDLCTHIYLQVLFVLSLMESDDPDTPNTQFEFITDLIRWGADAFDPYYQELDPQRRSSFVFGSLFPLIDKAVASGGYPGPTWLELADKCATLASISFVPFLPGSVNFGLRLTYRQEWRTLGSQDGELVRTIPLAPGQKENVSIKVLRRNKGTRQLETVTATETDTETTDTVKDSSEIMEEAASSNKWYVDGEAGYSGFGFSASVKAGTSEENAEKSGETKTKLSETMQRTATKMRSETKIAVTTDSEKSFEETRSSEIVNPNDEVPITLAYHRLQRQQEVHTYLAQVASVAFVAEELPAITFAWVQRHDWIISQVLLDESFRDALAYASANPDPRLRLRQLRQPDFREKVQSSALPPDDEVGQMAEVLQQAATSLGKIRAGVEASGSDGGGSITNIYDGAIQEYRASIREEQARERETSAMAATIDRLLNHLRQNILHYCRAVWSQGDPDARMLRYRDVYAPTKVTWRGDSEGEWVISEDSDSFQPLSELVNPAGPIGFAGNYAIYHFNDSGDRGLNEALTYYRLLYAEPDDLSASPSPSNTGRVRIAVEMTKPWLLSYHPYWLTFMIPTGTGDRPGEGHFGYRVTLGEREIESGDFPPEPEPLRIDLTESQGFCVVVPGRPDIDDSYQILALDWKRLLDPELVPLRERHPIPEDDTAQAAIFDVETLADMVDLMPGFEARLESLEVPMPEPEVPPPERVWSWKLNDGQKDYMRSVYHEYLLRKEHTRRFVVDTNSMVLNIQTGRGSTLEPFKQVHRYLDVLKAATEYERRRELLVHEQYGDPDIERVVLVRGDGDHFDGLVAGEATKEESEVPVPGHE